MCSWIILFMNFPKIPSLSKFVRKKENKNLSELASASAKWMNAWADNHLSYELEWLGVPIIQSAEDILLMQELIFKLRPDYIVETGVAHGGSLIFYSSLLDLLGHGQVIGVDIEIRKHNREVIEAHPMFKRIKLIEGSSVAPEILQKIKSEIKGSQRVLICLDSDHTSEHVLKELELYKEFVSPGFYIVVFDTITDQLADAGIADKKYINNGPNLAVDSFLKNNKSFERDRSFDKLWISASPGGYLKCIR